MALPRFGVIQPINLPLNYLRYTISEDAGELNGVLQFTGEDIVSPYSKFEFVRASINTATRASDGFYNIRCCYNNKYWVAQSSSDDSYVIVAGADEPQEDQSKSSCTLFEPVFITTFFLLGKENTSIRLRHVHLGRYLSLVPTSRARNRALLAHSSSPDSYHENDVLCIVDWESLLVLPKHVAFKGDNGKYLKAYNYRGYNHLQFASSDIGDGYVGEEVFMTKDGRVRIKNNYFGKFWRCDGWVYADSNSTEDPRTAFHAVKVGDNVIGLRGRNNQFCKRLSADNKWDVLCANTHTISNEARLVVEEVVIKRQIYNVQFRLSEAKIYNQKIKQMVHASDINRSDEPSTAMLRLVHTEKKSSSWNRSVSLKLGVKANIEAGVPLIADEQVEVTSEFTGTYEWGDTVETENTVESEYVITIPPRSKITVNLLATQASCDVPFSYTQRDVLINGKEVISNMDDGLYTGVNCFNFYYETKQENL